MDRIMKPLLVSEQVYKPEKGVVTLSIKKEKKKKIVTFKPKSLHRFQCHFFTLSTYPSLTNHSLTAR